MDPSKPGKNPFEHFGRKMDEGLGGIGPRVEDEVRRIIAYLNDEVVPEVRRNSSQALRSAAEQLSRLAQHLDDHPDDQGRGAPKA